MGLFTRKTKADTPTVDLRAEPVIDLTTDAGTTSDKKPEWGFPSRCPECGDYGYLDRIDVVREIMFQHCPTCWARWETPKSATVDA